VARVQVYLSHTPRPHEYRFVRPGGVGDSIPGLRLKVYVNLLRHIIPSPGAAPFAFPDCVLDTGAFLTVIPQQLWRHFRSGVVTPLPFAPGTPIQLRTLTIAGGAYPFDLGELTLPLEDKAGGRLAVRVVAKFTRDGGALTVPLTLGLRGGVLDGRVLRAEPDPAAAFGQAWGLEDP
jgi:hypothetical protein